MGLVRSIVFCTLFIKLLASADAQANEKVVLFTHRTDFIVGEKLNISASVYDIVEKQLSNLSSVLYIEIKNRNGNSLIKERLGIKNGLAHGQLYLDNRFDSDYYTIIAYTKWQKNFSSYTSKMISVINPYLGKNFEVIANDSVKQFSEKHTQSLNVLSKKSAKIEDISTGLYSISIHKYYGERGDDGFESHNGNGNLNIFYPEKNYANIHGKLIGQDVDSQKVSLSFRSNDLQVTFSETDMNGSFVVNYNAEKVFDYGKLSILTEDNSYQVIINDDFYKSLNIAAPIGFNVDTNYYTSIKKRAIDNQLLNAYNLKYNSNNEVNSKFLPFNPKVYILEDFKRFKSVRTTLIEIVFEIATSKNQDNYDLKVRGGATDGFEGGRYDPLILLDGIVVDSKSVLELPINQVDRIEVLSKTYMFGSIRYDGIISFHLKNKLDEKYMSNKVVLSDFQTHIAHHIQKLNLSDKRFPHLDNTLYWEPFREFKEGQFIIHFNIGENPGLYKMIIMKHDFDGNHIYEEFYEVK